MQEERYKLIPLDHTVPLLLVPEHLPFVFPYSMVRHWHTTRRNKNEAKGNGTAFGAVSGCRCRVLLRQHEVERAGLSGVRLGRDRAQRNQQLGLEEAGARKVL